jgi:endonuclease/exonuclease/phosphatase family metal-dependent hydrolase
LEALTRPGTPVLITGDFNCMPDSATYRVFMEAGFLDPYLLNLHHPRAWTFHDFKGQNFTPVKKQHDRMDWILGRGWPKTYHFDQCVIVRDAEPPLYPSDHYPVVVDITASQ